MLYAIRHTTKFQYTNPIAESVTEVRMQPRSAEYQQCSLFRLQVLSLIHICTERASRREIHFNRTYALG